MNAIFDVTGITIETKRLILREWKESDLNDLFEYASVPGVGENAGWSHHKNIEESRFIIKNVLQGKEAYAICLKEDNKAIGAIELRLGDNADLGEGSDTLI